MRARVEQLEDRVAALEGDRERSDTEPGTGTTFWALEGLKSRTEDPGAVLFTGAVTLPTGEHWEWQEGRLATAVLEDDWTEGAAMLSALAHPVRLLLLREILHGTRTVAELSTHESLGTTGQLYHHLRQLVSAGWLRATARGHYAVPGERVIPLLIVLAAVRR
ncbi:MAG: helix-turn-helix domain-containing protein [Pseudonocardiaceae bacterium]|nr:helix-turn-helix domain-containing protein [Pseudonocardiaceae bacterium]